MNPSQQSSYRHIWSLTWPLLLSGLSTPILGAVDTAILGHLDQPVFLGAVALGGSLLSMVLWLFGFLRMGTTSLSARAFGAQQRLLQRHILHSSLKVALGCSVVVLVLSWPALATALRWLGASPEVEQLALEYSRIRLGSAPAALMGYVLSGWLIGIQQPRYALLLLVTTNGLNILLDYLFIVVLQWNSAGAAWATVCAEYLGLGLCWRAIAPLTKLPDGSALAPLWRELLSLNRYLLVRSATLLGALLFFTTQGARLGDLTLASNAIMLNLLLLCSYALDGFAHSAEALAGAAKGANDPGLFYRSYRRTLLFSLLLAASFSLVFFLARDPLIALYTDNHPVQALLREYWPWLLLVPLAGVWGFHLDGIYVGLGASRAMATVMVVSVFAVFLPLWFFSENKNNQALWLALLGLFTSRSLLQGLHFYWEYRHKTWFGLRAGKRKTG